MKNQNLSFGFILMNRKKIWIPAILLILVFALPVSGLWDASNQLLFPVWRGVTKDLSVCKEEIAKFWGKDCGNLRNSHAFKFSEVKIGSVNGYELPGWLIVAAENGMAPAKR